MPDRQRRERGPVVQDRLGAQRAARDVAQQDEQADSPVPRTMMGSVVTTVPSRRGSFRSRGDSACRPGNGGFHAVGAELEVVEVDEVEDNASNPSPIEAG